MADKDAQVEDIGDNDEYQFADLDGLGTESMDAVLEADEAEFSDADDPDSAGEGVSSPPGRGRIDPHMMKIIKNGVIVVGGLILFLLAYKVIMSFLAASPDEATNKNIPMVVKPVSRAPAVTPKVSIPAPRPVQVSHEALDNTEKKVTALEQERSRLKTDLFAMQKEIRDVTQTVSTMTASLNDIKQSMEQMNDKMEQQSQQMVRLQSIKRTRRSTASKPKARKVTPKVERTHYYIQAIIPGRAWLMSTKGATLTVSRGSAVPGYGDVRLINPKLGRVFMSSGRVIQFSQADS
ncbi:MAG: type IVB secretion system protein IcmG/DotF [Legionellaceae bacterium]|nr:type IVB secretion system protein IcmG/DotF [Legionellaceae bacterium]